MKKGFIILVASTCLLTACGDKKKAGTENNSSGTKEGSGLTVNGDQGNTGSFTVDGTSFNGKSSTQYFGDKTTGQYSVLCEQAEPYVLLQAVFNNEKDAAGNLKPGASSYKVAGGEANITLSGTPVGDKEFTTKENSAGSIEVKGKKLILKDLELFNQDNAKKTVSAEIDF